ncbi:MAG: mechanosensitive ion channel family protein [Endozoicomonas sp. (ex Botrylloides leachii)]|nr:mechanosensitive ion channel family protein [Endozoicomonas sp. (ex Botrylloides leachii)]
MDMPIFQGGGQPLWLLNSISGIVAACTVHFVLSKFFNKMRATISSQLVWQDALLKGARRPVMISIWLIALGWIVRIIDAQITSPFLEDLASVNKIVFILLITWAVIRTMKEAENNLLRSGKTFDNKLDRTTITAVGRLLRVCTVATTALIIMQLLGFSISGILAFGGAGGLIVGYGAKDMLANLFGGLIVYMDKPFKVGDWIRSSEKDIEGTVEYIGWRQTRIRTFDKRPLYVPNSTFATISVENPSRMENRRIKETIGIRYEDSRHLEPILAETRTYLNSHNEVANDKIIMVNFNAFGPSSLDFFIYCFTKTTDWATYHMIKEQILMDILAIIHKHGADIAFPTRTIDIPAQATAGMQNINKISFPDSQA